MNVLSIQTARSIWLFPTNYLNPNGRSMIPAVNGIIERYSFLESTPPLTEAFGSEKKSLELKIGEFTTPDDRTIEVSLDFHGDGLVAETRSSTHDSDLFLEDVLTFLNENFSLAPYCELPINQKYLSEIFFALTDTPDFSSDLTNSFVEKSSSYINCDKVGHFQITGLHLATDPELSNTPSFIRVEREVGAPFSANRFFSSGTIKTSEHINLLEALGTVVEVF